MTEHQQRLGIYLLPNLLTSASLFSAFYSIVASMKMKTEVAIVAIFIGMIADLLDGRVARLTNTQSEFGAQFDSMSDMVTFGVAPSLVAYSWSLSSLGKFGWLICFAYTASVALRLARFNANHDSEDIKYFVGLPCPPSAGVVCGLIWFLSSLGINGSGLAVSIVVGSVLACCSALMVSNIAFYSFKEVDFKGKVPFFAVVLTCLIFIAVAAYPELVLFVSFSLFAISGPIYTWRKARKEKQLSKSEKNKE